MNKTIFFKYIKNKGISVDLASKCFENSENKKKLLEKVTFFETYLNNFHLELHSSIISTLLFIDLNNRNEIIEVPQINLIIKEYYNFHKSNSYRVSFQNLKLAETALFIFLETSWLIKNNTIPLYVDTESYIELVVVHFFPFLKKINNSDLENYIMSVPAFKYLNGLKKNGFLTNNYYLDNKLFKNQKKDTKSILKIKKEFIKSLAYNNINAKVKYDLNAIIRFEYIDEPTSFLENELFNFFDIEIEYYEDDYRFITWKIYSILTDICRPNPTTLRDYVSQPKENNYSALHVSVISKSGDIIHTRIIQKSKKSKIPKLDNYNEFILKTFKIKSFTEIISENFPDIIKVNSSIYSKKSSSFEDYLKFVNKVKQFSIDKGYHLLLRGQKRDYELTPSLYRFNYTSANDILELEQEFMNDFFEKGHSLINENNLTDIEKISICQHHGLPTRLLDWTDNPLIALWFACSEPNKYPKNKGIIWCYFVDPINIVSGNSINPFAIKKTVVYRPKNITERIQAQSGSFTIHPFIKEASLISRKMKEQIPLIKISLNADKKTECVTKLNYVNINDYTVMKDLDGLAKWIKNKKSN
jgi:hypothetical protein